MKLIIKTIFILFIWGLQINFSIAQNDSNNVKLLTTKEVNSMLNGYGMNKDSNSKIVNELDKFAQSHKNDKDSAWINDFNGHTHWDSKTKSLDGKPLTIIDSLTNNYYILDSTHTIITAYNKSNQIIWKTDPLKDSLDTEYKSKNFTIHYFKIMIINLNYLNVNFVKTHNIKEREIAIRYSNSYGYVDLETGKFTFMGTH